jgi:carboxypeptidase family protein
MLMVGALKVVLCGAERPTEVSHMRHTIAVLTLVLTSATAACTKNTSEPTSSTTTTAASTTTSSSTTSVSTTTVPATFTVRGTVTSEKDGTVLKFADIEIIQGANIGKRFQGDANGAYTMPGLSPGAFVARYWAAGYLVRDVLITITTTDLTVNVQLTPEPPTTSTVVTTTLNASFTFSPNPCTFSPGPSINCTVDSSSSTGTISSRKWNYAGKEIIDQITHSLSFACSDLLGSGTNRTISVRLTVFDAGGNLSTVDNGVPVTIVGGACP